MAHGRKRVFVGGVVAGGMLSLLSQVALIYGRDIAFGPPGYPLFEKSARAATLELARLSPFPAEMQSFTIVTRGNMFTREFEVAFFGEPSVIAAWVRSCPGVADAKTTEAADGTITYEIPAGGGAQFAKLVHHPVRGTVLIRTYWS